MMNLADAPPLRVLVADDHELVRIGVRALIDSQTDMCVVGEAGDGKAACRAVRELQDPFAQGVDVVVMDISMPVWNGIHATRIIRQFWPNVWVIALTAHTETQYQIAMREAGASGYVLKSHESTKLLEGIRAVAAGQTCFDDALSCVPASKQSQRRSQGKELSVSDRQEEVMRLTAQGFAQKEIAARLNVSVKTVETHKSAGMSRLGITTRRELVAHAVIRGWLDEIP